MGNPAPLLPVPKVPGSELISFLADRFRMNTAMRELRTPVMILVELSWEDPSGNFRSVSARMEDKSLSGACIRMKKPVEVGSRVRIQWRFEQFSGMVKYCRLEEWDYVVGIQRDRTSLLTSQQASADSPLLIAVKSPEDLIAAVGSQPKVQTKAHTSVQSSPHGSAHTANKVLGVNLAVETGTVASVANRVTGKVSSAVHGERDNETSHDLVDGDRLNPRAEALRNARQNGVRTTLRVKGREAPKEGRSMARKWLDLAPWQKRGQSPIASVGNNGTGEGKRENLMPEVAVTANKVAGESESAGSASLQVELLPMEDIYRAAGIMGSQKGYSIHKVVEMLNSEHIRGLSKEMRRASVLMALEAAGISIERVQQDAKARQGALESYEAEQRKQMEAEWVRKEQENIQIQDEVERVKARYMARVSRNLDGVAREKATFENWATVKLQEMENIAEVVDLCAKPVAVEPVSAPLAQAAAAGAVALGSVPFKV